MEEQYMHTKRGEIKIEVKCVGCGFRKDVGEEQIEMPFCDKCRMPMIAVKATLTKKTIKQRKK